MKSAYPIPHIAFEKAKPVWAFGRDTEMNLWLSFRTLAVKAECSMLRITGSCAYDVKINGKWIAFGPARSPHGYYRVDELTLSDELRDGGVITLTVAGYNANSYYHLDQPSFLCAELIQDGKIVAATGGEGFLCRVMTEHEQKAQRYSVQRTFCEVWNLSPLSSLWETATDLGEHMRRFALLTPMQVEEKRYLPRGCAYNVYPRIHPTATATRLRYTERGDAARVRYPHYIIPRSPDQEECKHFLPGEITTDSFIVARNIKVTEVLDDVPSEDPQTITVGEGVTYRMANNTTGKIELTATCEEDTEIVVIYDEFLGEDGTINFRRMYTVNSLVWRMKKGTYRLSTFEPYTLGALQIFVTKGKATVSDVTVVYFGAHDTKRTYVGHDEALRKIFHAAVETYRQNTFTVYMDCPSRERAGWLCDSFFTSRVEKVLTGCSEIEHNFLENFLLPDAFPSLETGMLPMCYPGDHYSGNYIPNWAMWFVIELEEYFSRTGDRAFIDNAKSRVYDLLNFFLRYENGNSILEKMEKWVFVEWSEANKLTQDINFPTNMLYAKMLDCVATLYGDKALSEKATRIRRYINENAITSEGFYCDNAVYDETGVARLSGKCTETCQYYAFFCGVTSPEENPTLWRRMVEDFGPERVAPGKWPELLPEAKWQEIYASNAFIGNYLRLELLYLHGEHERLVENIRGFFTKMAELTGTLWENETTSASCNHGFASHVLYWMDGLGMLGDQ
ncbi:MAG: hypothetical protein IJV98_05195 [Clostridia bacterium]|nr:hypothetical protein [Clostridia bacterium]